jgi:hypothetical protein
MGVNVVTSPSGKSHLLMEAKSVEEWRTQMHLIVEAAMVEEWDGENGKDQDARWQRVALWFSEDGRLHMEPPLVRWYKNGHIVYEDKTLSVRGVAGGHGVLLAAGVARIVKLPKVKTMIHTGLNTADAVAVLWKRGDNLYADEWEHIETLRKMVHIGSNRAARVIQMAWRMAVSDPTHEVCRRRLQREFDELET